MTLFFVGCHKQDNAIIIWSVENIGTYDIATVNSLSKIDTAECPKILNISFNSFSSFDNLFKVFIFKSQSDSNLYQKTIYKHPCTDNTRFYFAITENEEIRLKGEFLVSSAYNASKTKESLYMFFTSDGNLRMARDPSVFNFPESIELIDTSIIESKINSIYKKGNEECNFYKVGNSYYFVIDNKAVVSMQYEDEKLNNIFIQSDTFYQESVNLSDEIIQHEVSINDYSEFTMISNYNEEKDHPSIVKWVNMSDSKKTKLNIYKDGRILTEDIDSF